MDAYLPIFFLAGGEIFLALIAARVAVWMLRGLRDYWRSDAPPAPRGPGGGLRVLAGGARAGAAAGGGARLRRAA